MIEILHRFYHDKKSVKSIFEEGLIIIIQFINTLEYDIQTLTIKIRQVLFHLRILTRLNSRLGSKKSTNFFCLPNIPR